MSLYSSSRRWLACRAALLLVLAAPALARAGSENICWRQSQGRGVGALPSSCPSSDEKSGLRCYPRCRSGFHGDGSTCRASCPPGYRADRDHCTRDSPAHSVPRASYDRGGGMGLGCTPGARLEAGLCYRPCGPGYDGVGPVCWRQCSGQFPVGCGAACAATASECRDGIVNMVAAPLEVVATVALAVVTEGGSVAATVGAKATALGVKTAVKAGARAGARAALSASARAAAKANAKAMLKRRAKELGRELPEQAAESGANALLYLQETGQLDWKNLDPTGVANVVDAFAKPLCR